MSSTAAGGAAAGAAREHYGRLLASLARRSGDPAEAEDALAEAFARALEVWPSHGIPDHPDAWLLTVARNTLGERARHRAVMWEKGSMLGRHIAELLADAQEYSGDITDDRLRLMFVCAHPAIDSRIRSALMLTLVLGIEVRRIASAFLLAPAALAQRLVRAKAKIRIAGIAFELPESADLAPRTRDVIEAIYGAYTRGRSVADQDAEPSASLAEDALHLATTLEHLLPDHPEVLGLNSLLRYCEARRHARFDAVGNFVPLALQQTGDWNLPLIDSAELRLKRAARYQSPGPMQLEAAIQSAHCSRRTTGTTPWDMIAAMYAALCRQWPSVGAHVGAAVAEAECGRLQHAAHLLDMLDPADVANYPPFWAARGHILALQGQVDEAARAFVRAAGLTESTPVRAYLMHRSSAAAHPKTSQS